MEWASMQILLIHIFALTVFPFSSSADVPYELRIHESAEKGTRLTMSVEMQKVMEKMRNCFGQIETSLRWIEYRSQSNAFYTTISLTNLDAKELKVPLEGVLRLFCPSNQLPELSFVVQITKQNHYPPSFSSPSYHIYLPLSLPVGGLVTKLLVTDQDPVIYNSQRTLSFEKENPLFSVFSDGSITLKGELDPSLAYREINTEIVAVDYGSPQFFSRANLTIVPVTVSQVVDAHVNIATDRFQVFEWSPPECGVAAKYRLIVRRRGKEVFCEEEVDSKNNIAVTRVKLTELNDLEFVVSAVAEGGETLSNPVQFTPIQHELECEGQCAIGGSPLCFYGPGGTPRQFVDSLGSHCLCFPGHSGITCDRQEWCAAEKRVESWGGLDYPETVVNESQRLPCPYNADGAEVVRKCEWNGREGRAEWAAVRGGDRCQLQSSVLTHLGMLANYAGRADSDSTMRTVSRFLRQLLSVPAFQVTGPAHFDQKIAEHMAQVIDSCLEVNLATLSGNASEVQSELWDLISSLSARLPAPFALAPPSHGINFKVIHWIPGEDSLRTLVGHSCFVQLPTTSEENIARTTCMRNSTIFDYVDPRNPSLLMTSDIPTPLSFTRILFGLRPFNTSENFTCVFYDEIERAWSTRGIRLVSPNQNGFVICETTHLSLFSLLPEAAFSSSSGLFSSLRSAIPTISSVCTTLAGLFFILLAASQRSPSIDFALLLFTFFAFLLHFTHLLMVIAAKIGDPFDLSPGVQLVQQFCILSVCSLGAVLGASMHSSVAAIQGEQSGEKPSSPLCSNACLVFLFGVATPGALTFTTYLFAQNSQHDLLRVMSHLHWLFLLNYLGPAVLFLSLCIAFCISTSYSARSLRKTSSRSSSVRLALSTAKNASLWLVVILFFLTFSAALFALRHSSFVYAILLFSILQFAYSVTSFIFSSYYFRLRYMSMCADDGSTRSLERKRDISRALLEHVDTPRGGRGGGESGCSGHSDASSLHSAGYRNGNRENKTTFVASHTYKNGAPASTIVRPVQNVVFRSEELTSPLYPSSAESISTSYPPPPDSPSFHLTASLFERAPMVSMV